MDKEPYNDINNATRGFYHPKGCQNKANFRLDTCPALYIRKAVSHELIDPILPLYNPANDQYYSRPNCRCSSMEEHSFRKAEVEGSTPSIGFLNT